jgi:hypothetical protein
LGRNYRHLPHDAIVCYTVPSRTANGQTLPVIFGGEYMPEPLTNTRTTRATPAQRLPSTQLTVIETMIYSTIYGITSLYHFCLSYIWVGDDCRGPGAVYPGGCRAYSAAASFRYDLFFLSTLLLLIGLLALFSRVSLARSYRLGLFLFYSVWLVFGPYLILLPPVPAKG